MSKIRKATKEDEDAIVDILLQFAVYKRTPGLESFCLLIEKFTKEILAESVLVNVITCGKKITGVISCSEEEKKEGRDLFINFIAVSKKYHNKGRGSALIESINEYAKEEGFNDLVTTLNIYDVAVNNFFIRKGFLKTSVDQENNAEYIKICS